MNILQGAQGLSRAARSFLAWYLSLVRMGFETVKAPMGAITDCQFRASGHTTSESTAYRAHRELENHGYISRRKFRGGERLTIVDIHVERFQYWLQRDKKCDNNLHLSKSQTYPVTSTPAKLQTTNSLFRSFNSNRSKNHTKPQMDRTESVTPPPSQPKRETGSADPSRWKHHPVVYSCLKVLANDRDRWSILQKVKRSIDAGDGVVNQVYTRDYWLQLPHTHREHIAKTEIIPSFRGGTMEQPREQSIDKLIAQLCSNKTTERRTKSTEQYGERVVVSEYGKKPELKPILDGDDLKILEAAKRRANLRRLKMEREKKQ